MPQAVSVTCPSCHAVLKVTKPSLMGKRVACPSCKEPMRIPLPAAASPSPKSKAGDAPLLPSLSSGDDLETVPLLSDDDPPSKAGEKTPNPDSGNVPSNKPRSSAVWKKMNATETAEFEAMLSDTEDELDEPSFDLTSEDRPSSSGSIQKRGRTAGSREFDDVLAETDAEQDALTDEAPATRQKGKKKDRAVESAPGDRRPMTMRMPVMISGLLKTDSLKWQCSRRAVHSPEVRPRRIVSRNTRHR